jgi:hypothetical protein
MILWTIALSVKSHRSNPIFVLLLIVLPIMDELKDLSIEIPSRLFRIMLFLIVIIIIMVDFDPRSICIY